MNPTEENTELQYDELSEPQRLELEAERAEKTAASLRDDAYLYREQASKIRGDAEVYAGGIHGYGMPGMVDEANKTINPLSPGTPFQDYLDRMIYAKDHAITNTDGSVEYGPSPEDIGRAAKLRAETFAMLEEAEALHPLAEPDTTEAVSDQYLTRADLADRIAATGVQEDPQHPTTLGALAAFRTELASAVRSGLI
jgi:hypothetical protein